MTQTAPKSIVGDTFALDRHGRGWGLVVVRSIDKFGTIWVWDEQQQQQYPVRRDDLRSPSAMERQNKNKRRRT